MYPYPIFMKKHSFIPGLLLAILSFSSFINKQYSTAGTVSSAQFICPGDTPADITITGSVGSIQWQSSADLISWSNVVGGTGSTVTGVDIGALSASLFFRAIVTDGSINDTSETISITVTTTILTPPGAGTVADPYRISCFEHLQWIRATGSTWDKVIEQTADIDASVTGLSCYFSDAGWLPIGNSLLPFSGSFDGNGYSISHLRINRGSADMLGLFGEINGASITNVILDQASINGRDRIGALIGNCRGNPIRSQIQNIRVTNLTITADPGFATATNAVGGIAGYADSSDFSQLFVSGQVTGRQRVGGLVGWLRNGATVFNSSASAAIASNINDTRFLGGAFGVIETSGSAPQITIERVFATGSSSLGNASSGQNGDVGGFAGLINNNVLIRNCYATGAVTAPTGTSTPTRGAGSFAGRITNLSQVYNCYGIGLVTGSVTNIGGFSGPISAGTTIVSNCFWNTTSTGRASSYSGSGLTTAQMQSMQAYFGAGWDLQCERLNGNDDVWGYNPLQKDGYPFLTWEGLPAQCPEWTGTSSNNFTTGGNWVNNLIPAAGMDIYISATAARPLPLYQNWEVGHLVFQGAGRHVELGSYNLHLLGDVVNANSSNFLATTGAGRVSTTIAAGAGFTWPVGNSAYNPLQLTNNTGASDIFSVRVLDEVYGDGDGETDGIPIAQARVARTWDIGKNNPASGAGIDLVFNWNPGEVVGTLSTPALFHHNGSSWSEVPGSSTVSANSFSFSGYTGSFSPFAISMAGATLPVSWLSFTGQVENESVLLQWKTESERQSEKYLVQHSLNGINWNAVGERVAAGNSSSEQSYQLTHVKPGTGIHFYRIMQVDLDGRIHYSTVVRVQITAVSKEFRIYPNPATNSIYLTRSNSGPAQLEVYDLRGRLVLRQSILQAQSSLDIQSLQAGLYQLILVSEKERMHQVFIKR